MQVMQPQNEAKEIELERDREVRANFRKANEYSTSIIGRKRLRNLRYFLGKLGLHMHVPMGSAAFTHHYCITYAGSEEWGIQNEDV